MDKEKREQLNLLLQNPNPSQIVLVQIMSLLVAVKTSSELLKDRCDTHMVGIVPVYGDGNCMYRSISHEVYGGQDSYQYVRSMAANWLENKGRHLMAFVAGDFLTRLPADATEDQIWMAFIESVRNTSDYGCNVVLKAIANAFNLRVRLLHGFATTAKPIEIATENEDCRTMTVTLAFSPEMHYDATKTLVVVQSTDAKNAERLDIAIAISLSEGEKKRQEDADAPRQHLPSIEDTSALLTLSEKEQVEIIMGLTASREKFRKKGP